MEDKEQKKIELLLKKSKNNIKMQPFDERWKAIESELDFDRGEKTAIEEVPILVGQGVGSNSFNYDRQPMNKKKTIAIITCICLLLVLAIILPICLNKKEPSYFSPADLAGEIVTEEEFYEGIGNSGIDLVDLTKYQCQEFSLLKTDSGEVQGGKFSANNEITYEIAKVTFFSKFVQAPNYDFAEPEIFNKNDIEIQYKKIDSDEEIFQYKVYATFRGVTYKIDYYGLTDNVIEFLNNFFG